MHDDIPDDLTERRATILQRMADVCLIAGLILLAITIAHHVITAQIAPL